MSKFEKGRPKTGGRRTGSPSLTSFRKDLAQRRFSVAGEMIDLYRKTKDEAMKLELLKLIAEYSHTKPTTSLDEQESADVHDISDAALLKLAAGDTISPAESDAYADSSDQTTVREGESDAADALDAETDDGSLE